MPNEPTNKDLLDFMAEMKEEMATDLHRLEDKLSGDIQRVEDKLSGDIQRVEDKLSGDIQRVENKVDRVLFQEIDRHERWIKQIADKVGIKLV